MRKTLLIVACALFYSFVAKGQCDPVVAEDTSQFWVDGHVNATAIRGNTIYLGGAFYHIGQYSGHFAVIDTASGHVLYRATWPKVNGNVYKVIPDGAGGWIIGGSFSMVGSMARNNIAQIDASGNVTSFNPNADNTVKALLLDGSNLYIGGDFTNISGNSRTRLAKIDFPSGSLSAWTCSASTTVAELQLYGNKLYAGGYFTTIGGQPRKYIAAIDTSSGSVNTWNANATGIFVNTITFYNGKMFVGGRFSSIGGQSRSNLASLDTATGLATAWNPGPNGAVNRIIHNGSVIYVAGAFSSLQGITRNGFAAIDTTYGLPDGFDPNSAVLYVATFYDMVMSGNKIILGGTFGTPSVITSINYISFIDLGSPVAALTRCLGNGEVYSVACANGHAYIGGAFTVMDMRERLRTAAFDMDADTITRWNFPADGEVRAVAAGPSRIYVGGDFMNQYPYVFTPFPFYLGATDPITGAYDTSFHPGIEYPSSVKHILYDNGNLYITGNFSGIETYSRDGIAKLSASTGALNIPWDPADFFTLYINAIAADNNNIYIGGYFSTMGGQPRRNLAAVSKNDGHATAWNPSPTNVITSLSVNNGALYAGGYFDSIGTRQINSFARVNTTTGIADPWRPQPDDAVNVIQPYYNTEFIAGQFSHIGATTVNGLGSVPVNSNIPSSWNPHPGYDSIYDMRVYGNKLFVAGGFSSISGQANYPNFIVYRIAQQPDTVRLTGPAQVCGGAAAHFMAGNGIGGTNYHWSVNGTGMGTAADTFSYIPANGDILTAMATLPGSGCYTADSVVSNTFTVSVVPVTIPSVSISGPSSICYGSMATYTSSTTVVSPSYIWRVNGTSVSAASSYSYTPSGGDVINCKITVPLNSCYSPDTAVSNSITITTGVPVVPSISITGIPVTASGNTVTVTAAIGSAGAGYQVKWYKNGTLAATTTAPVYTYTKGMGTDMIKATVVPAASSGCYDTAMSNQIYIYQAVGVASANGARDITIYPNPIDGFFMIKGCTAGDGVSMYDATGRKVIETTVQSSSADEQVPVSTLNIGVYLVRINDKNGNVIASMHVVKQ